MTKRLVLGWLLMLVSILPMVAQIQDPIKFKTEWKTISENEVEVIFKASLQDGWHVYSTELGDGGPISATFNVDSKEGIELVGKLTPKGKEIDKMDPIFNMRVRYFEGEATFVQKLKITAANYKIEGYMEYGACNDENCLPPTSVDFKFAGKGNATASADKSNGANQLLDTKAGSEDPKGEFALQPIALGGSSDAAVDYWTPVIDELNSFGEHAGQEP